MSGFNTKEKNNYGEYEIAFYTDNHEDFKKVQDLCRELIDHDKPVSTEGDLISRSALKKAIFEYCRNEKEILYHYLYYKNIITLIDNAPTVEERPQGEWIEIPVKRDLLYNTGIKYTCSICGTGNCYGKPPFCMYCGAKMQKGGAE